MNKAFACILVMGFIGASLSAASPAQESSGCTVCHTDSAKIKSLYVPPKIEFKVEAGEG